MREVRATPPSSEPRVIFSTTVDWGASRLQLQLVLSDTPPPDALLTSVRGVVFQRGKVVMVTDPDGSFHVMPGGRRETSEDEQRTLRREIAEETGYSVAAATRIGHLAFEHLTPCPPGYPYPYPSFIQSLFVVEAGAFRRAAIVRDGWETSSRLISIPAALSKVRPDQRVLLRAAIDRRTPRA